MIDSFQHVLTLAGGYVSWESFGLWVAFLLSFPFASWIESVPKTIRKHVEADSPTEVTIFGFGFLAVLVIGLPAFGVLFASAWEAIDVLPRNWTSHDFLYALWSVVQAVAGQWMRLVYCALPIPLVLGFFQLLSRAPAVKAAIDEENRLKGAAGTNQKTSPSKRNAVLAPQPTTRTETAAVTETARYGLVPEPAQGEKLPEGWIYRPEPSGGH